MDELELIHCDRDISTCGRRLLGSSSLGILVDRHADDTATYSRYGSPHATVALWKSYQNNIIYSIKEESRPRGTVRRTTDSPSVL